MAGFRFLWEQSVFPQLRGTLREAIAKRFDLSINPTDLKGIMTRQVAVIVGHPISFRLTIEGKIGLQFVETCPLPVFQLT